MLDAKADEITGAARYERKKRTQGVPRRPLRPCAHSQGRRIRTQDSQAQRRPVRVRGDRTLPEARAERRGIVDRHISGWRLHQPDRRHQQLLWGDRIPSQTLRYKLRKVHEDIDSWRQGHWKASIRICVHGRRVAQALRGGGAVENMSALVIIGVDSGAPRGNRHRRGHEGGQGQLGAVRQRHNRARSQGRSLGWPATGARDSCPRSIPCCPRRNAIGAWYISYATCFLRCRPAAGIGRPPL